MEGTNAGGSRLATLEELIDADALRSIIATGLAAQPIDEQSVRRGVWAYVCAARELATPPGHVILTLTTIVEASSVAPPAVRDAILRRVILWCVDAYFGQIGERVGETDRLRVSASNEPPLSAVRASNR
jgi:hypothetical protein